MVCAVDQFLMSYHSLFSDQACMHHTYCCHCLAYNSFLSNSQLSVILRVNNQDDYPSSKKDFYIWNIWDSCRPK